MKTLFISGAFILAIASLGSTAFAQENRSNTSICNSIPPARPTGGATAVRLQALEQCYKGLPQGTIQSSITGVCAFVPPARPTGGATVARLEALQRCDKELSQTTTPSK
ncbi:hypothetical protein H6G81_14925 [Scytonema hofmannii FACHB-248]|uniref:Uncharacterized protein n=1 Tax=Scytonema hofmannii FACHB-248 TaxID=1842502 RepID=A0ABR8GRC0_9CYAN|nr:MULTISPECIES: hypothetical protein [Nostocales]MBD2605776.1 hypothetical protein [Scytonema hofmannii FACHB-248]